MKNRNFKNDPCIAPNVRNAIVCLRSVLLVYGYDYLVSTFNQWENWFLDGTFDFDVFRGGIALEVGLAFKVLSHDLVEACCDRNEDLEKKIRDMMCKISIFL